MSDEMDEIWALYLDDGTQSLDAMEAALLAVQDDPDGDNSEHVSALFRAVHTFKGNSRVLGLGVVESRAHVAEDLIGLVRDEGAPLDEEIIDILLYAGDILRGMLEETSNAREDVDPTGSEELMEQLRDKLARAKAALNGGDAEDVPAQTAQEPAAEAISDALAMLDEAQAETDQEDAGDDVADSEPEQGVGEAEPEPEPVEDTAPEVAPDPDPESESEPVAEAAEPVAEEAQPVAVGAETPKRLIDDPSYRDIFLGMANDALAKLQAVLDDFASDAEASSAKARKEVDNLHHAAGQMGLPDWVEFLGAFLADTADNSQTDVEGLAALILKLQEAKQADLCDAPDTSAPAPEGNFLGAISDALATLSQAGLDWTAGKVPPDGFMEEKASIVRDAAEAENLSRIAEIAGKLITATDAKSYREAELRLYEELTAVEAVLLSDGDQTAVRPSVLLRQWCSSHVFDTIAAIERTLEQFRSGEVADEVFNEFSRQMRLVFHACSHNKLDTAGQLAMSLIDLFSRVQTSAKTPDTILTHIARGFIDTIEIVFNAVAQGEIPDTQNLDDLFEQASNACFLSEGLMTATAIERALNLPVEFHRVLSPDSVRTASKAIENDENFFIVRADINNHEELAEKFLELISSDAVDAITNVTVFRGTDTLFDFLLATPLSQSSFVSQVAEIDPSGKDIKVTEMLHYEATGDATEAGAGGDIDQGINQGQGLTAEMLEDISEVAASQAMVNHMLADLSEVDLTEGVEALIRSAKGDTSAAFDGIKKLVSDHAARLQEICQVEGQLVAQMSHLQEQTVAIRSKPVEILIRPLEALVETISRKGRSAAKLTSAGGDLSIDVMLMENLRKDFAQPHQHPPCRRR